MTPFNSHQISLIEASFRKLSRHSAQTVALFYNRLFDFDPILRSLLENDLKSAHRKFFHHLGTITHRLDCYDLVRGYVTDLVAGHACFIDTDQHIRTIGAAFFWTLEQVLGDDFTAEVYGAWMAVFTTLSHDVKSVPARELALAS